MAASTEIKSFDEALKEFDRLARRYPSRALVFRGHANSDWRSEPSLFRQNPDISEFEAEMIRELVSLFPSEFLNDTTMFDRLVRMQHYGLPTRLLDVTKNPLVALYFALGGEKHQDDDGAVLVFAADDDRCKFYDSDVVSIMANIANLKKSERDILTATPANTIGDLAKLQPMDRLIQFIKAEKPYFQPRVKKIDLFRPIVVTAKRSRAFFDQSGSYPHELK